MSEISPKAWIAPGAEIVSVGEPGVEPESVFQCHTEETPERSLRAVVGGIRDDILGLIWGPGHVQIDPLSWRRFVSIARDSAVSMVYGNYSTMAGEVELLPMSQGSLRDEFDAGPMWVVRRKSLESVLDDMPAGVNAGEPFRYAIRLGLLRSGPAMWIPEPLCAVSHSHAVDIFGYVDGGAREVQKRLEAVLVHHLARIGALLPKMSQAYIDRTIYPVQASVIIPVRNREGTIGDAVRSALSQQTTFSFNVIVVENHSTDETRKHAVVAGNGDKRLLLLTPQQGDLGIGGCWNVAAQNEAAGKYLVQLDSDDVYSGHDSIQALIDLIDSGPWAMAVGSYRTVDMHGNEVPPGSVTHAEWTETNGHNNLLRVSGIGAPRVFATGLLREYPLPNVSYGEDYAVALAISRTFHVARLLDVVYHARRWEGNTDFAPAPGVARSREAYKDQLRTIEVAARKAWLESTDD